ncbi:MAG TPA: hypothetical protein VI564_09030 [Candidatus Nanoarchaeia archaeon]|nr:hypothetical protein [Candidatus Nanoarchaeia archaeon]
MSDEWFKKHKDLKALLEAFENVLDPDNDPKGFASFVNSYNQKYNDIKYRFNYFSSRQEVISLTDEIMAELYQVIHFLNWYFKKSLSARIANDRDIILHNPSSLGTAFGIFFSVMEFGIANNITIRVNGSSRFSGIKTFDGYSRYILDACEKIVAILKEGNISMKERYIDSRLRLIKRKNKLNDQTGELVDNIAKLFRLVK